MTLYPRAQWRPLGSPQPARMSGHDLIILHTMVGSLAGTDAYFHAGGYGGTESHFGVGHDGTTYQWTDLESRADANLDANSHAISIETADWGEGDFGKWDTSNPALVPAWTPEQVEACAQVVAWCCDRWGIPCELVADSKPGRRGVGYHRQGIDPYRVDGGEHWSTSYGKVCPGDRRRAQVPDVISRAQAILAGDPPLPPPDQEEDDSMPRYFNVVGEPADPNTYGYTDTAWWVANDEEVGAFGQPPRNINARQRDVLKSRVSSLGALHAKPGIDATVAAKDEVLTAVAAIPGGGGEGGDPGEITFPNYSGTVTLSPVAP